MNFNPKKLLLKKNKSLKDYLLISFFIHLLTFLVGISSGFIPIFNTISIDPNSVEVDLIGLPNKNQSNTTVKAKAIKKDESKKSPTKKIKTTKAKTLKPIKNDSPPTEKITSKDKSADELLKDFLKNKKPAPEDTPEEANSDKLKGNVISKGAGNLSGVQTIIYDRYYALIKSHVLEFWELPEELLDIELKSKILIKVNSTGNLLNKKLIFSSANSAYDELCMEAVDQSIPLPAPPENLIEELKNKGIILTFP